MTALKIPDLKQFTSKLFLQEIFDEFLFLEAAVITYNGFTIDGHIQKEYYTEEELEEMGYPALSSWKQVRPLCFSLIKGNRLPKSFKIVLQLPIKRLESLLSESASSFQTEDIQGLILNIRYEKGTLLCITGTSLKIFTMDKSLEQAWDQAVRKFLEEQEVTFEEE